MSTIRESKREGQKRERRGMTATKVVAEARQQLEPVEAPLVVVPVKKPKKRKTKKKAKSGRK